MAACFLAIPLKKTSEVDLAKPLRNYILSTFDNSISESSEIDEAITDLNKMRNKSVFISETNETSLDVLARYYDQLVAIENKLPITPGQISIAFKWKDAFSKGSLFFGKQSITLTSGQFERSCVLFNVGSLLSQLAASQSLGTDEELQNAAKWLQQSAGIFAALEQSVSSSVQQESTPDLLPDTLHTLVVLTLAQAQEAIYLKAARGKMKSSLLVKIAAQCGDFYHDSLRQMNKDVHRGLWDKDWIPMMNGKWLTFQGLAQYHQSELNKENQEIGEELSRLRESLRLLQQAQGYFSSISSAAFKSEVAIVQKALELATKDNDFIYHERIPDIHTLKSLPRVSLAKISPLTKPISPRFKDMFESLVPASIHQALMVYNSRKSQLINMETGRMREHTQLMNGILASLNLPAALDDALNSEPMPESIREKSSKVKTEGGIQQLLKLFAELPALLTRNREILDETWRLLTDEEQSDSQLRSQFKDKWARLPSRELTEPLWQEIGKFKTILETAKNADGIVRQRFETARKALEMLSMSESELKASIPGLGTDSKSSLNSSTMNRLRQLIIVEKSIIADRDRLENELKFASIDMSTAFLQAMSESGVLNAEQISSEKLEEIYGPMKKEINASIKKQEELLAEIQKENTIFCAEKSVGASGVKRENMLKLLAAGYDSFKQLNDNLTEGTKFYNDLTPLLVRVQQKVSDYCFARKTEKDDLMRDLQLNIVKQTPQKAPSAPSYHERDSSQNPQPPPRPPPPNFSVNSPEIAIVSQQPQPASYQPSPTDQQYGVVSYPYSQQQQQQQPYPTTTPYPLSYPGTYPGANFNPYGQQQQQQRGYAPYPIQQSNYPVQQFRPQNQPPPQ